MGFISHQIQASNTDTEIVWVQKIIDLICGIDSRITCNTTAAQQYADLTSASRATFDIDIAGKYKLRLKRSATNNTQTSQYIFSIIVNESEYSISSTIRMWTTNTAGTGTVSNGFFKVAAYITDNDIFIWFGAAYGTEITDVLPKNYCTSLITDQNNIAYCNGLYNSNDITGTGLYKCSDGTTGYALVKCLNYTESVGNISYIENNPISSTGAFAAYAKDIIACTTISAGTSIVLSTGEQCFAVGTNALVLIDE